MGTLIIPPIVPKTNPKNKLFTSIDAAYTGEKPKVFMSLTIVSKISTICCLIESSKGKFSITKGRLLKAKIISFDLVINVI